MYRGCKVRDVNPHQWLGALRSLELDLASRNSVADPRIKVLVVLLPLWLLEMGVQEPGVPSKSLCPCKQTWLATSLHMSLQTGLHLGDTALAQLC